MCADHQRASARAKEPLGGGSRGVTLWVVEFDRVGGLDRMVGSGDLVGVSGFQVLPFGNFGSEPWSEVEFFS